jgi:hypothetical protein
LNRFRKEVGFEDGGKCRVVVEGMSQFFIWGLIRLRINNGA